MTTRTSTAGWLAVATVKLVLVASIVINLRSGARIWQVVPVTGKGHLRRQRNSRTTGSPNARRNRRKFVFERDSYKCVYCGSAAETLDHIIPITHGGSRTDRDNLVAACLPCNRFVDDLLFSSLEEKVKYVRHGRNRGAVI